MMIDAFPVCVGGSVGDDQKAEAEEEIFSGICARRQCHIASRREL